MFTKYPVNYIKITQPYTNSHKALDLGWSDSNGGKNQPIYACESGTVIYKYKQPKGGNTLRILHEDGKVSEYAHMQDNSITVNINDKVNIGDKIGNMGDTGVVTGYHVHFALYKTKTINESNKLNPLTIAEVYPDQVVADASKNKYNFIYYNDENIKYVYNVDDEGLNVRSGAGTKYDLINRLQTATKVNVLETERSWTKIGDNAWVSSNYLSNNIPKYKTVANVTSEPLNVRNKASVLGQKVGKLYNGDRVQVYATKGSWSKVSNVSERWVSSKYLK